MNILNNNTYENMGYNFQRRTKQNMILDVSFVNNGNITGVSIDNGKTDGARTIGVYTININETNIQSFHSRLLKGSGATFTITVVTGGTATIDITNGGDNYFEGDKFTITDSELGGGGGASLVFHVSHVVNTNTNSNVYNESFSVNLHEPLHIDKYSSIFLDNFLTYNCNMGDNPSDMAACLTIDEFQINTNVASTDKIHNGNHIFNKIVIPNENNDINNFHSTVAHKAKKFNYICDINPCTLTKLSGKITNIDGEPFFHGSHRASNRFYSMKIDSPWIEKTGSDVSDISKNTEFVIATSSGTGNTYACVMMTSVSKDSDIIYFTSKVNENVLKTNVHLQSNIELIFSTSKITSSTLGGNPAVEHLHIHPSDITFTLDLSNKPIIRSDYGRFIAEFSIEAK